MKFNSFLKNVMIYLVNRAVDGHYNINIVIYFLLIYVIYKLFDNGFLLVIFQNNNFILYLQSKTIEFFRNLEHNCSYII